ncbi:MAG: hypothetical protein J2P25_17200 [Nocardiopsaceae bacterium]|nr:hypothetical protein [Nocardiopsaceae bacterium]
MSFFKRKWLAGLVVAVLAVAGLVVAPLASQATASARTSGSAPELWPKLSPFKTMVVSTLGAGATTSQQLAATTLEGAYNQLQGPNRLYVVWNSDDQTWLNDGVFHGVTWSPLKGQGQGAAGQLNALLSDYGHDIKGAIVANPSDSDTVNLATTMAGQDDAMVATPDQVPLLKKYGIPILHSFANTTFASPTAAYQWELTHLMRGTNPKDLVILNPGAIALRDYIISTKSFVFYLTSTDSSQKPLLNKILSTRPANTPVLGYIADEQPDVADLSAQGKFLNASDFLENGSDFAAMPSLPGLSQTRPQPVKAQPNTVYVAPVVSDGDNAQYVEHHMFDVWTQDASDLGAVPEGWTMPPGMIDSAPNMIGWYYQNLPRDSEMLPGPSGVGYATQMTGPDLQRFGQLSGGFMDKDSMSTIDSWEAPSQTAALARSSGAPSISVGAPLAYARDGKTAVLGQTSGYISTPSALLTTLEQDALAQPGSSPDFLEPLVDGWTLSPHDMLAVAQNLAKWGKTVGKKFVFTTPSEMGLTDEAYHQGRSSGLPELNAQAVSGAAELKLPSAGQLQGYTPSAPTGPNLIANPSGANGTDGWTDTNGTTTGTIGTLTAGTYDGGPDISWKVPTTEPEQVWAHAYPSVTDGKTYQFSVKVAGSGQVFMDVYNGAADFQTPAIDLKSSYQTLTWTVNVPANAPTGQNAPQLQVREVGAAPLDVHISDATVRLAQSSSSSAFARTVRPARSS